MQIPRTGTTLRHRTLSMNPLSGHLRPLMMVLLSAATVAATYSPSAVQGSDVGITVTGANFRTLFKNNKTGPANQPTPFKNCGGYVWASTGGFEASIIGMEDSATQSLGQRALELRDKSAVAVWFNIYPNGTHPWHVHENFDEFVTVMEGSGILGLMDPERQMVTWYPCYPGTVMTMPRGFMHMFRASSQGLQLLAFGDVEQANLALLPTYMATLPSSLQGVILGDTAATDLDLAWYWDSNSGSGTAFMCVENADDVDSYLRLVESTGNVTRCRYEITSNDNRQGSCMSDLSYSGLVSVTGYDQGVGYGSLNTSVATCIADQGWCTVDDPLGQTYTKLTLHRHQLISAIMPSGYIMGYVTKGSGWVSFYHPNDAYIMQYRVAETDLFYIPMDTYFTIVSTNDTDSIFNLAVRATEQLNLNGSSYNKNRILPLSVGLRSFRFPLAGAAFFPKFTPSQQEAAFEASPILSEGGPENGDECPSIVTGGMSVPLIFNMTDAAFDQFKGQLQHWDDDTILCPKGNKVCKASAAPMKPTSYGSPMVQHGPSHTEKKLRELQAQYDLLNTQLLGVSSLLGITQDGAILAQQRDQQDSAVQQDSATPQDPDQQSSGSGYSKGDLVLVGVVSGVVAALVVALVTVLAVLRFQRSKSGEAKSHLKEPLMMDSSEDNYMDGAILEQQGPSVRLS
eukprot:TRINITY_DN11169_c0_g5_i1.p1 TRINITY_DN11169_c0_g5~~TRINITY_DN11169_c0_g5_i1.p1  ORF type:complete len:683 (-),score=149.54 TRINITY_DN11169_c0_g5_i1:189-2237(-)